MTADTDTADPAVDLVEARAKLRAAHARVRSEEGRLAAVESGRAKAAEDQWPLRSRMADAAAAVARATRDDPLRKAYAFVNNADPVADDPVAVARAEVATVEAEIARLEGIENALGEEAARIQANLREHRSRVWQCMAEVIINSDQYKHLVAQHSAAWRHLRSVKQSLRIIGSALQGHGPQQLYDLPHLSEPLEIRVGYGVEPLVEEWRAALEELSRNADALLPHSDAAAPANNGHSLARPNGNNNHHLRAK